MSIDLQSAATLGPTGVQGVDKFVVCDISADTVKTILASDLLGAILNVSTLSVTQVSGAAPLASPTFTGVPAAPTAALNTNTTQVATTAFVIAQINSLGTAAFLNVAVSGDAASGEVVKGNDSRLSDARTPTAHTHPSSAITDFAEAVDDRVAALLVAGTNITVSYNDVANTFTINSSAGGGTVTTVSVASANGFAGTVANATTTPAITITTSVTGLLKGNGTAISAAAAGTDYLAPAGDGSALTGITASQISGLATVATTGTYSSLSGLPTLGTAAALNVPVSGNAASGEVVKGTDTRLTDSRTPAAHTHPWSDITSTPTTRAGYGITDAAPLASPAFTGTPTAPTASGGTNTTQIATTAFVTAAITSLIAGAPGALDTLLELADAINDDANFAATVTSALAGKQPLDADLTSLAAISTTGYGKRTGINTWTVVTTIPWSDLSSTPTTLGGYGITDAQPLDATLTALAALTIAANSLTIGTGADAFSQTSFAANTFPARASTGNLVAKTITDYGLSLVDDADASTARTTLGLATVASSGSASDLSTGTLPAARMPALTGAVTTSAGAVATSQVVEASVYVQTPANGTFTINAKISYDVTINQIRGLKTSAGTLTLDIKINGIAVTGLSGLSVTSTPQDVSATANNAAIAGSKITFVVTSNSSGADLEFSLKGTR